MPEWKEFEGCGIDQSTLLFDEHDEIWLPMSCVSRPDEEAGGAQGLAEKDNDAVQQVFERFVHEELEKLQAHVGSV